MSKALRKSVDQNHAANSIFIHVKQQLIHNVDLKLFQYCKVIVFAKLFLKSSQTHNFLTYDYLKSIYII